MTDALHTLASEIRRGCDHQPIVGVAASLGCEFLARAAVERPAEWERLALVSPTGLEGHASRDDPPGSTRRIPGLHALLSAPLWADPLFRLLTKPAMVRYFLRRTWGRKQIDETLWAYEVDSARQPGARFAPLHFLSGGLFSSDIHRIYQDVRQPVWMSHGIRGDFTDYRSRDVVTRQLNWRFSAFPTGALPYFEMQEAFVRRARCLHRQGPSPAGLTARLRRPPRTPSPPRPSPPSPAHPRR